ncbi:long-chain-fatty-acid--CoA ligase 2 [Spathaspora passalidarum NRRL Y-27907]|uniref:Long-chain-fatty-acid--CoA ligase 2 n=1 Tax=Spathaspora passalidarum (strain NRRL Y-27907 / 11-Y1) TaxID=619300 RepID=G3AR00_SPAPN|nr:long-chain-fatty-acid--CoA ligase 2 [Spathaspora passalidarum NRRL Y-27907]EGW31661.1 long-chain-fatty-acid--CoA ligase 2 [Spathaspora passalidarum NRRL Y-27907]
MSYPLFTDITKEEAISRLPFNSDIHDCVPIGPSDNPDYSSIYRNKVLPSRLINTIHADLDTHHKLFNNAVELFSDRPCLGARVYDYKKKKSGGKFEYLTYGQVREKQLNLGAGFIHTLLNNPFKNSELESHRKIDRHLSDWNTYGIDTTPLENTNGQIEHSCSFILSIFSMNRVEWMLTDLACSAYSITNTALYDTLGADVTQYLLELTNSPIVVCSMDKIDLLLDLKAKHQLESLISVVSMDPYELIPQKTIERAYSLKVVIKDLSQIEEIGAKNPIAELPPSPQTLYTISFTSGTTGSRPKGAMISHQNAAAYASFLMCFEPQASPGQDTAFVFLPLTHIYERETSTFALCTGYYLGFPQLTVGKTGVNTFENLIDDLRIFKPTYFSIVPRILTRLEALVKSKINELSQGEQTQVNNIINYKITTQAQADGATAYHSKMDNYAPYKALRSFVGFDNLKWVQTASAPIAPSTLIYLKASLNMGIRQLYGLTEVGAAITCSSAYEAHPGTCGSISLSGEYTLRNVSEMGYDISRGEGEVLIRGPQVFKGYYYNLEETKKTITKDGWFHSGDIAKVDGSGRLIIVDRVKNFFKMAQGEYISPEKIENRYLSSNPTIAQLYVHGNSLKPYLVGIVGIEYDKGLKFLNSEFGYGKIGMSPEEMLVELNKIDVRKKFLEHLNRNVRDKLSGYELLHNIHIEINPLTVERDVVTPTFKIRRPVASKFFARVFHRLYEIEQSLVHGSKL